MSCFNSNFPHMYRVGDAPGLEPWHRQSLVRIAQAITRRTGLTAAYDVVKRGLFFYYGDEPDFGVIRLPAFYRCSTEDGSVTFSTRRWEDSDIDNLVRMAHMGRASPATKDHIAAKIKQREEWDRQEETERFLAERRPDAIDYDGFLLRKRRGVAKVIDTGVATA